MAKDALVVIGHASTSDGKGLSEWTIKDFGQVAVEENALIFAADGEFGNPGKKDIPHFRNMLLYCTLTALKADYPTDTWRYINAGHSGGAGYASYCSMYMIDGGLNLAGTFLSGGNYSPLDWDKSWKLKSAAKKTLRLYYSFGKNDPITKR